MNNQRFRPGCPSWFLALLCLSATSFSTAFASAPRFVAEWEPALGTLIKYPLAMPLALVEELAKDDLLYCLVNDAGAESLARSEFQAAGVDLGHVVFIRTEIFSVWTRDWGPPSVFDSNGQLTLIDPRFDGYPWVPGCAAPGSGLTHFPHLDKKGYEIDDAMPWIVAQALGMPSTPLNIHITGGNFMADGHGIAYSTQQMVDENAAFINPTTFFARAQTVLGIHDYRILNNPEGFGIQHIDCYAKLLDEETVLVKQLPTNHPEYACSEAIAAAFANMNSCYGRRYRVERLYSPVYDNDEHAATYINCLILNRKVLVPLFGLPEDGPTLDRYRELMPGYEIVGFPHPGGWYWYDALHCRTLAIFDPAMLRVTHAKLGPIESAAVPRTVAARIDDRSEAGIVAGSTKVFWRLRGASVWQETALQNVAGDDFAGVIPAQQAGSFVEYYLSAADLSGRVETLPRTAPAGFYSFQAGAVTDAAPGPLAVPLELRIVPNPFNPRASVMFHLAREQHVVVEVFDVAGRRVALLADRMFGNGEQSVLWDGQDAAGMDVGSGEYFVRVRTEDGESVKKAGLVR